MDNHKSGSHAELVAASYFASLGNDIFWPLPGHTKADFIRDNQGTLLKVQVKKASWSPSGYHRYLQARLTSRNKNPNPKYIKGDFDEVVFVDDEERIWVAPFDDIEGLTSVCLDGTKEGYKTKSNLYDPDKWRVI
jgi:hypothetical protein